MKKKQWLLAATLVFAVSAVIAAPKANTDHDGIVCTFSRTVTLSTGPTYTWTVTALSFYDFWHVLVDERKDFDALIRREGTGTINVFVDDTSHCEYIADNSPYPTVQDHNAALGVSQAAVNAYLRSATLP